MSRFIRLSLLVRLIPIAMLGCVSMALSAGVSLAADESTAGAITTTTTTTDTLVNDSVTLNTGDQTIMTASTGLDASSSTALVTTGTTDQSQPANVSVTAQTDVTLAPSVTVPSDIQPLADTAPSANMAIGSTVLASSADQIPAPRVMRKMSNRSAFTGLSIPYATSYASDETQPALPQAMTTTNSNAPLSSNTPVPTAPLASGFISALMAATGFAVLPVLFVQSSRPYGGLHAYLPLLVTAASLLALVWLGYSYLMRRSGYTNAARSGIADPNTFATPLLMSYVSLPLAAVT